MGRRNPPASAAPGTGEVLGLTRVWTVWALLAGCVWAAFSPVLDNGFVDWDDQMWILENHEFQGLGWEQIRFAFTTDKGGVYQPLGWLLQSLTYICCGLDPRGYHLAGLLFHVANVILLHLLCVRLVTRTMPEVAARLGRALPWLCAVPVGLYAVHPLRVEPVAWASCQAYLPGVTFSLLATLAYLRAHPPDGGFDRRWMTGSSLLVVLAVLSKGSAVVLPFVFLILDVYPLRRLCVGLPSWAAVRGVLAEKAVILAFCLAMIVVAVGAKSTRSAEVTAQPLVVARLAQASFGACFYLEKTAWPFGITAFYPRPEGGDFGAPRFAVCFAAVILAVAAAFGLRRRWPWLAAALLTYLVIASPYLGLARVSIALASDRYSYAPTMVWVVLGCAGLCRLAQHRWSPPVLLGAGAGTLIAAGGLMVLCAAQCRVWSSSERLWSQAVEHAGWSAELHQMLGSSLADAGKLDRAVAEFEEALRIRPGDFKATCDLGVTLNRLGDTEPAIAWLRRAEAMQPEDTRVLLNLSAALVRQGQVDEGIAVCRRGIELDPEFPNLHYNLGLALTKQRKFDEAIGELNRAVELRPEYAEAYTALGGVRALQGRQDEAARQYRRALELDPDQSAARINLGLALARQGRSTEAITELREATLRDRDNPEAHHALAAILVASGRIEAAAAEFEEVLRLRPDHPGARLFMARLRGRGM